MRKSNPFVRSYDYSQCISLANKAMVSAFHFGAKPYTMSQKIAEDYAKNAARWFELAITARQTGQPVKAYTTVYAYPILVQGEEK